MSIVNLHEMLNPVFGVGVGVIMNLSTAEFAQVKHSVDKTIHRLKISVIFFLGFTEKSLILLILI